MIAKTHTLDVTKRELQRLLRDLRKVSPEGWELLAKNRPNLTVETASIAEELAEFLRS